jgi:hypothetical protein
MLRDASAYKCLASNKRNLTTSDHLITPREG